MTAEVSRAGTADLARLVTFLDEGFVFGKGRSISLAHRFPGVFDTGNAQNLFFIEQNGLVVSALAARPFVWLADGRSWRGAMVGSVLTETAHRGAGFAGRLLSHAAKILHGEGADFAVLWTAQADFYRKLGWQSSDRGMFGEAGGRSSSDLPQPAVAGEQWDRVRGIRARWQPEGLQRHAADYGKLPLPAESVHVFLDGADGHEAYALVGRAGTSGIVYEMIGHPDNFAAIWRDISVRFAKVLINDCEDSESHRWHKTHSSVAWQAKPLAMWLPLSSDIDFATMRNWYVPYFDRI